MTSGTQELKVDGNDQPSAHGDFSFLTLLKKGFWLLIGILFFLAVLSYHPSDSDVILNGVAESFGIRNWVGRSGAWIAHALFMSFGLTCYPGIILIFASLILRLTNRAKMRITFMYLLSFLLIWVSISMFLGIFKHHFAGLVAAMNLPGAGGVLGQKLCDPDEGWISYSLNPIGAMIVSMSLLVIGGIGLWYYDWADTLTWLWQEALERGGKFLRNYRERADLSRKVEVKTEKKDGTNPFATAHTRASKEDVTNKPKVKTAASAGVQKTQTPAVQPAIAVASEDGEAGTDYSNFELPGVELLNELPEKTVVLDPKELQTKKQALQRTLESFGIDATVEDVTCGPRVTLFEIKPAPGVKVERISSLQNNLKMELRAESIRILTPVPGRDTVGIEIPNTRPAPVNFRELIQSSAWNDWSGAIPLALGKNISGSSVILDLAKAPHLLIAGATGSGKSVCMNSIIMSLLYRFRPDELKMILVDPKVVEFAGYSKLPHLVAPVINDVKRVPMVLEWAVKEMERRYRLLSKVGVRNIASFNSRDPEPEPILDDAGEPIPPKLPFIVIFIDELADIMMTAKMEVETYLARIAQMARAVGIHAVIATQRPSVNVITGVIKANFPTRIAFRVTSVTDSRTILDGKGAEALLGQGDMLFKGPNGASVLRVQGCYLSDEEIENTVSFLCAQAA
ncbi:MAG: DNA translocase FtsK, partial [Lentisphaerae bacterium]